MLKIVWENMKKILIFLYPEVNEKIQKNKNKKRKSLTKEEIKIFVMALAFPLITLTIFLLFPLKISNIIILGIYIILMIKTMYTLHKNNKLSTQKIVINISFIILILLFLIFKNKG